MDKGIDRMRYNRYYAAEYYYYLISENGFFVLHGR